jgi:hypothetical protein
MTEALEASHCKFKHLRKPLEEEGIKKLSGIDPEIYSGIDKEVYPRPRVFSLSANLNF